MSEGIHHYCFILLLRKEVNAERASCCHPSANAVPTSGSSLASIRAVAEPCNENYYTYALRLLVRRNSAACFWIVWQMSLPVSERKHVSTEGSTPSGVAVAG